MQQVHEMYKSHTPSIGLWSGMLAMSTLSKIIISWTYCAFLPIYTKVHERSIRTYMYTQWIAYIATGTHASSLYLWCIFDVCIHQKYIKNTRWGIKINSWLSPQHMHFIQQTQQKYNKTYIIYKSVILICKGYVIETRIIAIGILSISLTFVSWLTNNATIMHWTIAI